MVFSLNRLTLLKIYNLKMLDLSRDFLTFSLNVPFLSKKIQVSIQRYIESRTRSNMSSVCSTKRDSAIPPHFRMESYKPNGYHVYQGWAPPQPIPQLENATSNCCQSAIKLKYARAPSCIYNICCLNWKEIYHKFLHSAYPVKRMNGPVIKYYKSEPYLTMTF